MSVDELTLRADEAARCAADALSHLEDEHDDYLLQTRTREVSRRRFSTLVERIRRTGAPFGAHTIVYRRSGELLLVRHEGVDLWVLPGGEVDRDESFAETARRELEEEAGVEANYDGLAMITRMTIRAPGYETWGVMPVFAARAETVEPEIRDPDEEISAARWFATLPDDTRDREDLLDWRARALE